MKRSFTIENSFFEKRSQSPLAIRADRKNPCELNHIWQKILANMPDGPRKFSSFVRSVRKSIDKFHLSATDRLSGSALTIRAAIHADGLPAAQRGILQHRGVDA